MAKISSFRDLLTYQRARKEAAVIFEVTKTFPREERYSLIDKIRRSSLAVSALPPDQQSAWASQATTVVEAVVCLVADGLGGPTDAAKMPTAQSERGKEASGMREGHGVVAASHGDGASAETVAGWEEEGCSALLPGTATACATWPTR